MADEKNQNADDELLKNLGRILYGDEQSELPPQILARVREADRKLREEQSLLRALRRRVADSIEEIAGDLPEPSFAIEGAESEDEDDPIGDAIGENE